MGASRQFLPDERGAVPVQTGGPSTLFVAAVVAVLGGPLVVAMLGALVRRENAFQYVVTAAAALVAVFTLTGTVQFAPHWTVLGILGVLAAIASHLWQYRGDRLEFVIVGSIYVMPVSLATVLLVEAVGQLG